MHMAVLPLMQFSHSCGRMWGTDRLKSTGIAAVLWSSMSAGQGNRPSVKCNVSVAVGRVCRSSAAVGGIGSQSAGAYGAAQQGVSQGGGSSIACKLPADSKKGALLSCTTLDSQALFLALVASAIPRREDLVESSLPNLSCLGMSLQHCVQQCRIWQGLRVGTDSVQGGASW